MIAISSVFYPFSLFTASIWFPSLHFLQFLKFDSSCWLFLAFNHFKQNCFSYVFNLDNKCMLVVAGAWTRCSHSLYRWCIWSFSCWTCWGMLCDLVPFYIFWVNRCLVIWYLALGDDPQNLVLFVLGDINLDRKLMILCDGILDYRKD